jgi:hypothetical protein
MTTSSTPAQVLEAYVEAGLALVKIPHGLKAPKSKGWNKPENCIVDVDAAGKINGSNIGLAHAYCTPSPTGALDIDDMELAVPWLKEKGIDLQQLLDAPGAVQITSGREGRAKLLYRLPSPMATAKPEGSGIELRCAAKNGTTVQDVLPPSIHPDTGKPYEWIGDFHKIPPVPDALLSVWEKLSGKPQKPPGAEPPAASAGAVIAFWESTKAVIKIDLQAMDPDCGYDAWFKVGAAIYHESGGSQDGLDVWTTWSARGKTYKPGECASKWASFRTDRSDKIGWKGAKNAGAQVDNPAGEVPEEDLSEPSAPVLGEISPTIAKDAPGVLGVLVNHYMTNARRPEHVYAIASALVTVVTLAGRNFRTPSGARMNVNLLVVGATGSGKHDIKARAEQIVAKYYHRPMKSFEGFLAQLVSAEGVWWYLAKHHEVTYFDEEIGELFRHASKGGERWESVLRTLRLMFDSPDSTIPAPPYSQRKGGQEMPALTKPFLAVCGTTTEGVLSAQVGELASNGTLNRFTVLLCDGKAVTQKPVYDSLPDLKSWAGRLTRARAKTPLANGDITVAMTTGAASKHEAFVASLAGKIAEHPGTWQRADLRALQIALVAAVAVDPEKPVIDEACYRWAQQLVEEAAQRATDAFAAEGGLADNGDGAIAAAFMATFDAPMLYKTRTIKRRVVVRIRDAGQYAGRPWRRCKDTRKRQAVVESLLQDGFIEAFETGFVRLRRYSQ